MTSKTQGIYLYSPSSFFGKIKEYIELNYDSFKVYGTSEPDLFVRDFMPNFQQRNIKAVTFVITDKYSQELAKDIQACLNQLATLQQVIRIPLNISLMYTDPKVSELFRPLARDYNILTFYLGDGKNGIVGISDELIKKGILSGILKNNSLYQDTEPKPLERVVPFTGYKEEIINCEVVVDEIKSRDIKRYLDTEVAFSTTMDDLQSDMKDIELRLEVSDWTTKEMSEVLDSFDTGSSNSSQIEALIMKHDPYLGKLNDKAKTVERKIEHYRQEMANGNDSEEICDTLNSLSIQRDNLETLKEISQTQTKRSLLEGVKTQLTEMGQRNLKEFETKLEELKQLEEIKDSEQRIGELKARRKELMELVEDNYIKFHNRYHKLESELNTEQQLLVSKITEGTDNLNKTINMADKRDPKIISQIEVEKTGLQLRAKEVEALQKSRADLIEKCTGIIKGFRNLTTQMKTVLQLDANLIHEYDKFTEKLKRTKTIQMVVDDQLATKLELFVGKDGVGVTATAVNYAYSFIKKGKSVLLVDFDTESPELHYYCEKLEKVEDLANFLNCGDDLESLSQLNSDGQNLFVTNEYQDNTVMFNVDDVINPLDMANKLIDKLILLENAFDKIVVIGSATDTEVLDVLIKRSGTVTYVTDMNPSNIEETGRLMEYYHANTSERRLIKVIFNKFNQEDIKMIMMRLGTNVKYRHYTISYLSKVTASKLEGSIYSMSTTAKMYADIK